MKDKNPLPDDGEERMKSNHRKARFVTNLVAILGMIFLFLWFYSIKGQFDLIILLYCLAPIILLILLNLFFNLSYKKRKD